MSRSRKPNRGLRKAEPVNFEMVRQLALALPGVEEGTSYGRPSFKVGGKFLAFLCKDGESLVIRVEYAAREVLMGADPETFYVTDYYSCYPMILVQLSRVQPNDLRGLLEEAWRNIAPRRLVADRGAKRAMC